MLEALIPLAFIPLRTRMAWLAIPGFAIVLLANSGLVWRMGMHYAALWIPWLLIAFAAGIPSLRKPRIWTTVAFVLSSIVLIAFSPLHPLHYLKPSYHALGDARTVLAVVPAGATVSSHDEWYTAITARHAGAEVLGTPFVGGTDYIVFASDFPNDTFRNALVPRLHDALACGDYHLVAHRGSVLAYKRGKHPQSLERLAKSDLLCHEGGVPKHPLLR